MHRILRFIGLGLAGLLVLAALGVVGLYLLIELQKLPRDHRTVWIDGPGDTRIRGVSWIEGGSWIDGPSEHHEYTEVVRWGADTLIGRGPAALDSASARLHEQGDRVELVVEDVVFRRTREGSWARFRALDVVFLYRHYAPLSSGGMERAERSWRYHLRPIDCRILAFEPERHRMTSRCGGSPPVELVFERASYDAPWVVDPAATFAETPAPERTPFPESARVTLTALRIAPGAYPAAPASYRSLERAIDEPGVERIAQRELTLETHEPIELALAAEGIQRSWSLRRGWLDANGWPVVLWSAYPRFEAFGELRAQPWGAAVLVHRQRVPGEDASYAVYLELDPA